MTKLTKLFEPGRIGSLKLKNRLVMAAHSTWTADAEGFITERSIDYYVARAKGGVGLMICTAFCEPPESVAPGRAFFNDDKFIPMQRKLADAVHARGGKIATQLVHHGLTLADLRPMAGHPEQLHLVSASAVPSPGSDEIPREATREDIKYFVEAFSEAARRVRDAGFDAVELHGAHGYLISEFLSPRTNVRTDEYGGSPEKRARFACEVISRTRQKVGPDFPIIFRLNGSDSFKGGMTIEDALRQAPLFVAAGADALHVSAGGTFGILCYLYPSGALTHLAQAVKKVVKVPVITVGKLGDPVLAEGVLREGKADFVAMARPLIADPELPNKAEEGCFDDIRRCIYCNMCTSYPVAHGGPQTQVGGGLHCSVNPELTREREFQITPATSPKKVMVVGGGLAGMEAARVLAERGHQVSLYERSGTLGGQWNIACQQEGKESFASLTRYLVRGLDKAKVNVILNKEVTPELVRKAKPDTIVVATGGSPATLNIPGADRKNVVQAVDIIAGKAETGERVVVVGGRHVGMEVAISLAKQGKKVSLITRRRLGRDVGGGVFQTLRQSLVDNGVAIYPEAPAFEITDDGVDVAQYRSLFFLKADTVVLAVGTKAETGLAEALARAGYNIRRIGDCVEPRDALDAIYEGRKAGCEI